MTGVNSKISTTMKKIYIIMMAAAAMLAGCAKEAAYNAEEASVLTVEVADNATKTYTEGGKIYWNGTGEQLNIIYFADESTTRRQSATHTDYKVVDNKATFTADFTPTDGAVKYTFGAFYPYVYKYSTSSISLTVPQEQTPTATSYDPAADIMVTAQPTVVEGLPSTVQFQLARMVAIGEMTLKGIGEGELINKVVISSPAKPAGAVEFKVHEANTLENAKWYNNYEDITLNMGDRAATGNDVVWFTAVPTDLSGSSLNVTVVTDKYTYSKEIDLTGKTLKLERGDIARFSVANLTKAEKPKSYKLLTDASDLTPGDIMVISTKGSASSSAYLFGTEASGTKCKVSSSTTILDGPEIIEIPENARIFTVESGAAAGTLSFKAADGYLYGNYDDVNWTNTIGVKAEKDGEASWTVSVNESNNKAYIYNSVYNTRCVNCSSSGSSATFNFASPSSYSYYVYIYYINGTSAEPEQPAATPLATPVVTATAAGNTVTATWDAVQGAKDYTVTCGTQTSTVTETTATFADLDYATEYTVSVVANPADAAANTVSEAGSVKVATEAAPAGDSGSATTVTVKFPIGATKSGNTVGTIDMGDSNILVSSTGSWRDNKTDGRDCIYIGRTSSNELRIEAQNGKTITKVTLTAPAGYLVDLKWKEYDGYTSGKLASVTSGEWTGECKSRIVFTPNGSSHSNIESITVEYK